MSEDVNPMVVDFLLSRINFYYLDAYNKLASLDYPIHDYKSFCEQLWKKSGIGI